MPSVFNFLRLKRSNSMYDLINVKDSPYNATGDGTTDDRASIQAAFDVAFGTAASPHGNTNRFLNKPVYFPAGNYKVSGPLYLNNVVGGHIFGAGANSSRLSFSGSYNGNTVVGNGITALLMTDGFQYSRLEGLNIAMPNGDNNNVGFYLYGSSLSCNANTFSDLLVEGGTDGMLIGYQSPATAVSECLYINVTFGNCTHAGLRVIGQNTLNHWIYGGGGFSCGNSGFDSSAALYSCPTGSIPVISGTGNADNIVDVYNNGAETMSITGCRTESFKFVQIEGGTRAHLSGCIQDHASATRFATVGNSGIVVMDGCRSVGTAATISGSSGSSIYLRGCTFTNSNVIAAYTGTVGQNI